MKFVYYQILSQNSIVVNEFDILMHQSFVNMGPSVPENSGDIDSSLRKAWLYM